MEYVYFTALEIICIIGSGVTSIWLEPPELGEYAFYWDPFIDP